MAIPKAKTGLQKRTVLKYFTQNALRYWEEKKKNLKGLLRDKGSDTIRRTIS